MRQSRAVTVGGLTVGGGAPVSVQSMTNTRTADRAATLRQIARLEAAGCQLVRLAVNDSEAAEALPAIRAGCGLPLVGEIHYHYRLALRAVQAGVDKIRINPGNIGGDEPVRQVVQACAAAGIPIRIGVNSGSVEKKLLEKYGGPTPTVLVESALSHIELLNRFAFENIIVAIKASTVRDMVEANRLFAAQADYPLHLGVTEAGTPESGIVKSAIGIGALLMDGIGDTIRVSLTADPVEEIPAAFRILRACGLLRDAPEVVSCPTCGRTEIDLIGLAQRVEAALSTRRLPIRVAVMGCVVNGPGEAREADVGVAGGRGQGVLFAHGEILRKVPEEALFDELMKEIDLLESRYREEQEERPV